LIVGASGSATADLIGADALPPPDEVITAAAIAPPTPTVAVMSPTTIGWFQLPPSRRATSALWPYDPDYERPGER
jgi:hypothetical protein